MLAKGVLWAAARNPIHGPLNIARFFTGLAARAPAGEIEATFFTISPAGLHKPPYA